MDVQEIKKKLETDPEKLKDNIYNKASDYINRNMPNEADQMALLLFKIDSFIKSPNYSNYKELCERQKKCESTKNEIDNKIKLANQNINEIFDFFMWFKENHIKTSNVLLPNPRYGDSPEPIWHQIKSIINNKENNNIDDFINLFEKMKKQIDFFPMWPCERDSTSFSSLLSGKAIRHGAYLEFYKKIKSIVQIKEKLNESESLMSEINQLQKEFEENNSMLWSVDVNNFVNMLKNKLENPFYTDKYDAPCD